MKRHFQSTQGHDRNLFSFIDSIFGQVPGTMKITKLQGEDAVKKLKKQFSVDIKLIYDKLKEFSGGSSSMKTFAQQMSSQMGLEENIKDAIKPCMFTQILHFLNLKEEVLQCKRDKSMTNLLEKF